MNFKFIPIFASSLVFLHTQFGFALFWDKLKVTDEQIAMLSSDKRRFIDDEKKQLDEISKDYVLQKKSLQRQESLLKIADQAVVIQEQILKKSEMEYEYATTIQDAELTLKRLKEKQEAEKFLQIEKLKNEGESAQLALQKLKFKIAETKRDNAEDRLELAKLVSVYGDSLQTNPLYDKEIFKQRQAVRDNERILRKLEEEVKDLLDKTTDLGKKLETAKKK